MILNVKCPYCEEINPVDIRYLYQKEKFVDDARNQTSPKELGGKPLEAPGYFKEIKCKCGWSYFFEINVAKKL